MARQARSAKIDSRTARAKLPAAHDPVWHKVGHALHLGYRKSAKGSSWIGRGYDGARYFKSTLGRPDDDRDADGTDILSFSQAVAGAMQWWGHRLDAVEAPALQLLPITVRAAAEAYKEHYIGKGGKDLASVKSRLDLHVLPTFGDVEIVKLTRPNIEKWLFAMAASPRLYRAPKIGEAKTASLDQTDPDAVRRRQSAANRTLTVLKAVLNHAFAGHDAIVTDKAWKTVKPFGSVDAARERSLSDKEVGALLAATSGPFRDLVQAALLTGCRYGELSEATVGHIDLKQQTLFIARSKSGHSRHVVLTAPAINLFGRLANGRAGKERIFLRADGEPWRDSDQLRPMRAACKEAGIDPPVGFHILRHTHASELVMRGVSLQVVAKQIGHRSTIMTEKHYAHLQPSYISSQINAALPNFLQNVD